MARRNLFYEPPKGQTSGLPHDPFKSFVTPRPIGWTMEPLLSGPSEAYPEVIFVRSST